MQNLARDEAGNVWELDPAGNPLRMVEPAAPAQGRVFSLPQNPREARQEARAEEDQQLQRETAARTAANEERRIQLAEQEANRKEDKDTTGTTAKIRADAIAAYQAGEAIEQRVKEMRRLHKEGPGSTGWLTGLQDLFPTQPNRAFDQAGNAVRGHVGTALGFTGGQLNTATEAAAAVGPYLPDSWDFDENAQAKMDRLLQVADESKNRAIAVLGGVPDAAGNIAPLADAAAGKAEQKADNEVPDPTTGADLKPPPPGLLDDPDGAAPQTTAASGDTRTTFDARMSSQINSLINAGASKATIDAVLKRQNFPILTPSEWTAVQGWRKQNPGKKYYGADISRVDELSMLQKAAGSSTGAFLAHMGNAATAGIPAALAGPTGQGALDAMSAANPNAAGVGGIVGGISGAMGAEAALAARAPAALAQYAPRIADTLYGGLLGFNTAQEGEGGMGALAGAGAGLAGGFLGDRALRGVAAVTGGVQNPAVRYLRDRGIPLTVGQTVEGSGAAGRTVKGIEDALTSIPGVGNMIDARRLEGLEAFNRSAFQDAAAPGATITDTGAAGMGQVRQSVTDAYGRALDPVTIDPTVPQFGADLQAAIDAAQAIPNVNSAQDAAMSGLQSRMDGAIDPATGLIPGRNFQEAYRGLARTGRERANSDYGHEVGQVMRQGQDALGEALERQNPGAFGGFLEANAANRRANVLADALKNAANQADELVTPAQLNRADVTSTSRLEGKINSASGNRPFYDLTSAAQQVLPSRLPDSGTAKRAIVGALTTGTLGGTGMALGGQDGAGIGTGGGLLLSAALALGGTRTGQRALTAALTERPDFAAALADALRSDLGRRIGGSAGAGTAASLTAY